MTFYLASLERQAAAAALYVCPASFCLKCPRPGSGGRDGGGYLPLLPDHPAASAPAQPVYVSWRKLFAFLRWSNKQPVSSEVGGRRSGGGGGGVSALFSSPGADKELFDRAERNESDLGQLI